MNTFQNRLFPKEEPTGTITIEGDKIISKGKSNRFRDCEISIKDIQYVYVIASSNGPSNLFFFDHHQNWLPTNYTGFAKTYEALSEMFGFDDNAFFEIVRQKTDVKKAVWKRKYNANYQILAGYFSDYDKGFEIQSPEKEFICWEATYEQLENNPYTYFEQSPYDQKILRFKYPVRVGNVLIMDLKAYFDNGRKDVPVQHFFTNCYDQTNSDLSYHELKKQFKTDFREADQVLKYERDDQNSFDFNAGGVLINLVYTYDSNWQFNDGSTSFSIKNNRDYSELLIDPDFENSFEVSDHVFINEKVGIMANYKQNNRVKRRPVNLLPKSNNVPLVWIDYKNKQIGFADNKICQAFSIAEIESFTIQNILPGRGSGGAYFEVNLKAKGRKLTVFSGNCHVFNNYRDAIADLTGLKVVMAQEYYDC